MVSARHLTNIYFCTEAAKEMIKVAQTTILSEKRKEYVRVGNIPFRRIYIQEFNIFSQWMTEVCLCPFRKGLRSLMTGHNGYNNR